MKVCNNCNRSNIDSTIFCLTCGSAKLMVLSDRFPWEDEVKDKLIRDENKSESSECSGDSCKGNCLTGQHGECNCGAGKRQD